MLVNGRRKRWVSLISLANHDTIYRYWEERVKQTKGIQCILYIRYPWSTR